MAEGLADLGLEASVGDGWGPWAAEILGDLGLRFDGDLAERIAAAAAPLNRVRQDAAILLHDRGATPTRSSPTCSAGRWSAPSGPRQQLRFLTDPLWRAYISTYVEGFDLLSRWLAARPAGQPVADRFVRLLDEPLTPARRRRRAAGRLTPMAPRPPQEARVARASGRRAGSPSSARRPAVAGRPVAAVAGAARAAALGAGARSGPAAPAAPRPTDGSWTSRLVPTATAPDAARAVH